MTTERLTRPDRRTEPALGELVDLTKYPIDRPAGDQLLAAITLAQRQLRSEGCAVVRDFVPPGAVRRLNAEIVEQKPTTHFSTEVINPYFHTTRDDNRPDRHPVNTFIERSSGFIPGDSWETGSAIDVLFRSPAVASFLARCLEVPALHCYDDPLAGLTANILEPGQQFTWHFDTNEFAVTVLVQEAADGGLFEYVPAIRSTDDEGFDAIQAVLEGSRTGVRTLDLRPGDLQIFRGRHSLHRVTRVDMTSPPRHAAILAYTLEPGVIGRVERTQQLFGRVLPEHVAAESERVRSDQLTD